MIGSSSPLQARPSLIQAAESVTDQDLFCDKRIAKNKTKIAHIRWAILVLGAGGGPDLPLSSRY
jgi:hypothetical protein